MPKKKKREIKLEASPYVIAAVMVGIFILGAVAFFLVDKVLDRDTGPDKVAIIKDIPKPPPPPVVKIPPALPDYKYKVAIVIDDMGRDISKLNKLSELDSAINIAILPYLKDSKEIADKTHERGWNVILHLPMEPQNIEKHNPGEGALLMSMTGAEVRSTIRTGLESVPHAIGINNHMGSRFTEDEALMKVVMSAAREEGVFFLDSKTTAKSVGEKVAQEMGVKTASRSVFLDNVQDKEYIRGQIKELISVAKKNGTAIGIGHPYSETISVLIEIEAEFAREGVRLVRLDELVR
ncbi:MAG: divergent polysaccharide deacetylase family protein [Thermodesulfobacteriota bacterium]